MQQPDWPEPEGWPEDARRDRLMGDWFLYQRTGGHRTSTDDVLTAWFAVHRTKGPVTRYLDLGCGLGSVLLMTAHRLRPAHCTGVEAQPQSVELARRSVAELPPGAPPIDIVHSDFRAWQPSGPIYDLITGSPPYFPLGTGVLPDDAQRRACRFEARGGIEAYCETAARCLAEGARFYAVFQTTWDDRVRAAAEAAALHITATLEAHMREDRPEPFLHVYEMAKVPSELPAPSVQLAIRDSKGELSPEYREARRELGV